MTCQLGAGDRGIRVSIRTAARRLSRPAQDDPNNSAAVGIPQQIAPSLSLGFSFPIQEENGPYQIVTHAAPTISDSPDFAGGSLTVSISTPRATDNIGIYPYNFLIVVAGSTLFYNGVAVGTVSGGGFGGAPLTITFNANATVAIVQELVRYVSFEFTEQNPPVQEGRSEETTPE